jgi:tetratricopeptide (TPR) repeat protein
MVAEAPRPDALRLVDGALDPLIQPQCSLTVQLRRATGSIVGRSVELAAIGQELRDAAKRLTAVTLEGEPGIGKTRLLVAAADLASEAGFATVAITADEEIRGPFLVARSLFAAPALREAAAAGGNEAVVAAAESSLRRVVDALSGRDEPGFENLSPAARQLRAFDLAGIAVNTIAGIRPLALLLDDAQWCDDDTLRLLRYVVRSVADQPIFLFLTLRPDELAAVPEAVNFVADMERMGVVRRLRPGRFSATETAELVTAVLGGPVDAASGQAMHVQSEGVPFIVEELARTHREAGTLQHVNGEWRLGRNAARLVPSAVRTLIGRRAARLPDETRAVLGDAALLGRSFSLKDVHAIRDRLADPEVDLAAALQPATAAGLLLEQAADVPADFTFTHEQVRDFAAAELSAARRRKVHGAIVDMLLEGGQPAAAALPMLAQHALAAGDMERAGELSIEAATAALHSNAPEESLRLVEQALPVVSAPADRRVLLLCRDDAFALLRRSSDRLESLAELASLAEAMRDTRLELDVQLRRAAALRMARDEDAAAELARGVIERAASQSDKAIELRANLELGQALSRTELGDSFGVVSSEIDAVGAEDAFRRAVVLAEELKDDRTLAAALREVATLVIGRLRTMFVRDIVQTGEWMNLSRRLQAGETVDQIVAGLPLAPLVGEASALLERALGIYERINDRSGVMSTVIAMAYLSYAPLIHLSSSARHLEEIKRVISRQSDLVTESERAKQELHLLYGIHVYGRAKSLADVALSRGEEAYRSARLLGDQSIQFAAAGGVALTLLSLGDVPGAERWLDTAATVASAAPTPVRGRQLETWRGLARAAAGDAAGMRAHLERAVQMATASGKPAARCEALTKLAVCAARLGGEAGDEELLGLAEESAREAKAVAAHLPGHPEWDAECDAALATVAQSRGDIETAVIAANNAVTALATNQHEDVYPDVFLPASEILLAYGPPEAQAFTRSYLQLVVSRIAQATVDEEVRVRWLKGPIGSRLVALAGQPLSLPGADDAAATAADHAGVGGDLDANDRRLLVLLTEGLTNHEMAERLGVDDTDVAKRLARILATLGASDRAQATTMAFRGLGATVPVDTAPGSVAVANATTAASAAPA